MEAPSREVNAPVILLTDFGSSDAYVGVMKGRILTINPGCTIIDLCHEVSEQNIVHAAVLLADNYEYFPPGSIFCCVVDPGVGSSRKALVLKSQGYTFVGPDNGLFTSILDLEDTQGFRLAIPKDASKTFHGRDVFAPQAARISLQREVSQELLPIDIMKCIRLEDLEPENIENGLKGRVLYSDHFGNLITNLKKSDFPKTCKIQIGDQEVPLVSTYSEMKERELSALFGSTNRLELSVKNGSAALSMKGSELRIIAPQE